MFGAGRDKTTYYGASVSMDGRWLIVSASTGTAPRDDVWLADLTAGDPATPLLVPVRRARRAGRRAGRPRRRLYVLTDRDARAAGSASPTRPRQADGWRDLIAEDATAVLRGFAILDG